jgi:hypothetical protein
MTSASFDIDEFRAAYQARNPSAWLGFYAEDAEWIEYGPDLSACRRRTVGREAIRRFLQATTTWPEVLAIEEPEIDADRVRFCVRIRDAEGHRMVEHVMLLTQDGRIRRQVDVDVAE